MRHFFKTQTFHINFNKNNNINCKMNTCAVGSLQCPVRRAINEIRGGMSGNNNNDNTGEDDNLINGGLDWTGSFDEVNDADTQIVCDNIDYYVTSRKLEFARNELNYNAGLIKLNQFITKSTTPDVKTFGELWQCISKQLQKNYIREKFVTVVDRIHAIEQFVLVAARKKQTNGVSQTNGLSQSLGLSLPTIVFDTNDLAGVQYKPNILWFNIIAILQYFRELNINAFLSTPFKPIAESLVTNITPPTIEYPPNTLLIIPNDIPSSHKRFEQEMIVAQYIQSMEKLQCAACKLFDNILMVTQEVVPKHVITNIYIR